MASVNHQFYDKQDSIYKCYRKTVAGLITGTRTDPYNVGRMIGWVLQTPERNFDYAEKRTTRFTYDEEVLEIYSELDDRVFRRANLALFEQGLLVEYDDTLPTYETVNDLNDGEVLAVAGIQTIPALKKRLAEITSKVTLVRIKQAAVELDRSVNIVKVIDDRIAEVA